MAEKRPRPQHLVRDTHKDRSHFFLKRSAFPLRDAMPAALEDFWLHQDQFLHVPHLNWEEAGPSNFAGRVTCLLLDPQNQNNLFAGSAAGGVWKSTDAGAHWVSCWPKYLNQNIGALAIDPNDSTRVICATGEGNLSSDSYPGSGVYETADAGMTWTPYFTGPSGGFMDDQARLGLPRRIGTIAFGRDKHKQFRVALGAVSNDESLPAAFYMARNSLGLQPDTSWGVRSYNCYAVVFHPSDTHTIYIAIEPRGSLNGIWRSQDFGQTWEHLKHGLPAGEHCGRISLAISPSNPEVLYALISSTSHSVLGVFRTHDGGEHWHSIGGNHFAQERQMSYNNTVAVHPTDSNFAVCGGVDLHLTRDGGRTWHRISTGQRGDAGDHFPANFVHSDHHAVVIDKAGWIYSGNDGGVALTKDGGKTWVDRSNGMVTAMFYTADVAQSNSRVFGGGTQDNGTLIAGVPSTPGGPLPLSTEFTRVLSSDGGWIEFDPSDEEHVFGSTQDLAISRHRRGEPWAAGKQLANWTDVSISPEVMSQDEKQLRGLAVLEIEPGRPKHLRKLWLGTNRLWRTESDGHAWRAVSPSFDGSAISAIECASADKDVLFVGTSLGKVFRSTDGGETWSGNLANATIPQRLITRIGTHPRKAGFVVLTVAASGVPGTSLDQSNSPYAHVFESLDMGVTWRPLDGLPDVVYNALAFETHEPYRLFVGGDSGVWMYDGTSWASIAGNMPNVVVSDLSFHHADQILTAATYGRGIWRLKVHEPFPTTPPVDHSVAPDNPLAAGLMRDSSKPAPQLLTPPHGTTIKVFPRVTTLTWQPVPEAIGYTVDVFVAGFGQSYSATVPALTFDPGTDGDGTWRVWAIFADSRRSPGSETRSIQYAT